VIHRFRSRLALATLLVAAILPRAEAGTTFEVRYAPELHAGPVSARVHVMLGPAGSALPPRIGPNWFNPQPFFAVEAKGWKPGEPLVFDDHAAGYPGPLSALKPGRYSAQAVVRLNPDTHKLGDGEGNAFGPVVKFEVEEGHEPTEPIALSVDQKVPSRPFRETDRIKLVEIDSPLLSAFHGRPIRHRAAVILPERPIDDGRKLPTLYIVPGFGGDHHAAHLMARGAYAGKFGEEFLRVVLDPDCGTGHHVFADSATNGPRGKALIEELIPHIERTYPALADPRARLLTGHSSGGWSTLWLQVTYPEFFGGTWSTSPDPVDFRDFQRIDLYADGENMFRDRAGERRPIARRGTRPVLWYDDFSRLEEVIGDGGQLRSFEAVFSPLDESGRPRKLWDRATGAVDPETARAWEKYDIRLVLERRWPELAPKLAGKLHVYMGDTDTFYLEGATRLLGESLAKLGSDAAVELFPGKDHSNLFDAELSARIDREMRAAVAPLRPDLAPREAAAGR
jgi:hypothetical protein